MSRLYIANVTRQDWTVCYRLGAAPGAKFDGHKQQTIPAGRQQMVGGDFAPQQIGEIVDQLSRYGMVGVVDIPRLGKTMAPLVYNIDKPVSADAMRKVRGGNELIHIDEGTDRRAKAAIATNDMVTNAVRNEFARQEIDADVAEGTDVSFEQLDEVADGQKPVEEGYKVRPEGQSVEANVRSRRGKRLGRKH